MELEIDSMNKEFNYNKRKDNIKEMTLRKEVYSNIKNLQ